MKPTGLIRLNADRNKAASDSTLIVSGPPRSGTSLVAAALHAAGLWLGDRIDHACFEDLEMAGAIEPQGEILRRPLAAARNMRFWRLALKGPDIPVLQGLIASRNTRFTQWGVKRPNVVPILAAGGLTLFRNPRLIMIFRDPLALAERISIAEAMSLDEALRNARLCINANIKAVERLEVPTLLVSYEKAIVNLDAFFAELFGFCGLAVAPDKFAEIAAFVEASGAEYQRLAAGPRSGFIGEYSCGVLSGWCRTPGRDTPETVDIYAGDTKIASVVANQYRPDLRAAGFGNGRHGFTARIDHLGLTDPAGCGPSSPAPTSRSKGAAARSAN